MNQVWRGPLLDKSEPGHYAVHPDISGDVDVPVFLKTDMKVPSEGAREAFSLEATLVFAQIARPDPASIRVHVCLGFTCVGFREAFLLDDTGRPRRFRTTLADRAVTSAS